MATIATLKRMSAAQLSDLVLAGSQKLAIIDVRDDDHIGGHIKGSLHFPSGSLDVMMPTLVRKVQDAGADTVVFHCALSQQRGPSAALRYARELEWTAAAAAAAADQKTQPQSQPKPQVYVLDLGFVGWQEKYGEDERLTERFSKEIWRSGNNPYL